MPTLIELGGIGPTIGIDVFLAPTAVLVGDVRVGDRASVWFGAVLRADSSYIEVGEESSIQDNVVIHCAQRLPTIVGARATVGHGALLEGCVIEDEAVIGMGSIVLQRARIGAGAMIAAGTVVPERADVGAGVLSAGIPAQEKKPLSGSALTWTRTAAQEYQHYRERYMTASRVRHGQLKRRQRARDADRW
jgi:carbonic anhydrase/acetyltransferase-like protein (isoleucine patch superfamily)